MLKEQRQSSILRLESDNMLDVMAKGLPKLEARSMSSEIVIEKCLNIECKNIYDSITEI